MSEKEILLIKDKIQQQQEIIKQEHRKPKALRNTKRLQMAMQKSQTYKRWINE